MRSIESIKSNDHIIHINPCGEMQAYGKSSGFWLRKAPLLGDGFIVGNVRFQKEPRGWAVHRNADELIRVLQGEIHLICREEDGTLNQKKLSTGESVIIPKDTWHHFRWENPVELFFMTNSSGSEYAEDLANIGKTGAEE